MALAEVWISARCSSVRNGAGASSTSFWLRRCSRQSRVPTTMTLPCVSARTCASTCRELVEEPLDEALAAAERRHRLADGESNSSGISSIVRATFRPRPPPPKAALMPASEAVLLGEGDDLVGVLDRVLGAGHQGSAGLGGDVHLHRLVAEAMIASGPGPIQVSPASRTAWAKSAFSDGSRNRGGSRRRRTLRRVDDLVDHQVGVTRRGATEGEGLVGDAHVQGVAVGLGVDSDAGQASSLQAMPPRTAISPRLAIRTFCTGVLPLEFNVANVVRGPNDRPAGRTTVSGARDR